MTPERFISAIRNRLPKRFHTEVIRENIGYAYSMFLAQQRDLTQHRRDYYDVAIVDNGSYSYSLLPSSVLNIRDAVRVEAVLNERTRKNSYIFEEVEDGESQIMNELEVSKVSDIIGFIKRSDRLIYYNVDPAIEKVNMRLVIPFQNYGDSEEFYLPEGADELIIDTVTNFLMGTPPSLDLNDGSEITA